MRKESPNLRHWQIVLCVYLSSIQFSFYRSSFHCILIGQLPKLHMSKEKPVERHAIPEATQSPKAPIQSAVIGSVKRTLGAKKIGRRTGGLGLCKLTTKPNESIYHQKPEEPARAVASLANSTTTHGPSFSSRFEYEEIVPAVDTSSGGTQVISHVAPPKLSSFFAEFGMDCRFSKKSSSSSSKNQASQDEHGQGDWKEVDIFSFQSYE